MAVECSLLPLGHNLGLASAASRISLGRISRLHLAVAAPGVDGALGPHARRALRRKQICGVALCVSGLATLVIEIWDPLAILELSAVLLPLTLLGAAP